MPVRAVDDKPSDTLVVVSGEGFWTGSSTLPHLHQYAVRGCSRHHKPLRSIEGAIARFRGPPTNLEPIGRLLRRIGGGYTVDLDATGGASSVTGSMVVSHAINGGFTVDLECTRTIDGLLWIGGDVTQSTYSETPAGTRAAIVFERGFPVKAIFVWQGSDPRSASCQAFFDDMIASGGREISEQGWNRSRERSSSVRSSDQAIAKPSIEAERCERPGRGARRRPFRSIEGAFARFGR
jgi:hypothetical protein